MADLDNLIAQLEAHPDCVLLPPAGLPQLAAGEDRLPADLERFYRMFGGALIFPDSDYGLQVRAPDEVVLSNSEPAFQGRVEPGDISEHWYLIANGMGSQIDLLSIDLHPERLGRCYDSFWDVHASPGDCAVVATSFTDLLRRALNGPKDAWWWTVDGFEGLGDAYDARRPAR
jgi:hypothetical protein